MLYLATASTPQVRDAIRAGRLGQMRAQAGGARLVPGATWAADNGCFTEAWDAEGWWRWVRSLPPDPLFVVAPDVVGDAAGTLDLALPWLRRMAGMPRAYVAQDGAERTRIPWDEFEWLFVGGTTAYKLSREASRLADEARARGKRTHMGRVNSLRRLRFAYQEGYDTVDGTFLAFGPDLNLPRLLRFLNQAHAPALFDPKGTP